MKDLLNELRQTARTLMASPGFALTVLGTLAAAVALETTTLSVVNAYLFRSLPYPAAERLYRVSYSGPDEREPRNLEAADWRSLSDVVEEPIAWDLDVFYMTGGEYPERVGGQWVTPGFMRGLGIHAAVGRSFRDDDFRPGAPQVALISDQLWHRRFAADPSVLGKTVRAYVSDRPQDPDAFTVVGVLPSTFWHVNPYTDLITPLRAPTYPYFVRLREGITPTFAAARLESVVRQSDPGLPPSWHPQLESVHGAYTRSVRPLLAAVTAAVTMVLLIACANVTLLMVLRGMKRRAEIAVRVALGASGRHVARLFAGESILLCAVAAVAGTGIAYVLLRVVGPVIEQQMGRGVPGGSAALKVDGHVGVAVLLLVIFMTVATSLPTVLVMRRRTGGLSASTFARGMDGLGAARVRTLLVSLQIAGSFGLLAGCAMLVRTVRNLVDVDIGMRVGGVVEAGLATREQRYPTDASRADFHERLLGVLERSPGIARVALGTPSPLLTYQPRRLTADVNRAIARASVRSITADWFSLLGIPIVDGRAFTPGDRLGADPVAIVSETLARTMWPASRAVGQRIRSYEPSGRGGDDSSLVVRTVVGVVRDVRQTATDSLLTDLYVPLFQAPARFASIVAAAANPPVDWASTLRRAVRSVDAEATLSPPKLLSASVDDQLRRPRFLASLFAAFGFFAFAIGILGVYGVTAYGVRQREREIAVRIAVGADRRNVVRLFLRQAGVQLMLGLTLGVFAAVAVGRVLSAQLFGTAAAEPDMLALVGVALGLATASAVAWPAWRAGGMNLTNSLRGP